MIGLREIRAAGEKIAGWIRETPCLPSDAFSERTGAAVHFKYETLQRTGSFKPRGALNKILSLTPEERERGVMTASAGNHAQGVAFAAATVGVSSLIVMPETTPLIKISRTRRLGGEVQLRGFNYDEAYERAMELCRDSGRIFVHPFDDDTIIAGQGTLGLEILRQVPDLEAVVLPVGGGGLAAGVATAVKESRPQARIFGIQTQAAPAMKQSLDAGKIVHSDTSRSIADGIAVKRPGATTFPYLKKYLDDIRLVSEEEIEEAIFELLETGKVLTEGAGAAGVAALLHRHIPEVEGKKVVVVLSGANIDLNFLDRIIERALVRQHRLIRIRVTLKDQPGALAALLEVIAREEANVVRISHNRIFTNSTFWEADVELTLESRDEEHIRQLVGALRQAGYASLAELDEGPVLPGLYEDP